MTDSKPTIFIVDDNHTFRKVVWDYLENTGDYLMVGEASDGVECLEKIQNIDIDIILMDINMPNMDGIQTSKIINYKNPNIPKIIALTQHDEFEYVKSMIEAGAIGYIVKAEVGKQLIKAIEKAIKGGLYYPNI